METSLDEKWQACGNRLVEMLGTSSNSGHAFYLWTELTKRASTLREMSDTAVHLVNLKSMPSASDSLYQKLKEIEDAFCARLPFAKYLLEHFILKELKDLADKRAITESQYDKIMNYKPEDLVKELERIHEGAEKPLYPSSFRSIRGR